MFFMNCRTTQIVRIDLYDAWVYGYNLVRFLVIRNEYDLSSILFHIERLCFAAIEGILNQNKAKVILNLETTYITHLANDWVIVAVNDKTLCNTVYNHEAFNRDCQQCPSNGLKAGITCII